MKLYKVHCAKGMRFAGSKSDASKARMALVDELLVKKMSVKIDEFDVGAGKAGILDALNRVASEAIYGEDTSGGDDEGDE